MYAVIETGGKQYRVKEGDVIVVEKLKAQAGEKVEFDKVLCLGQGDKVEIGQPYLNSAVTGQVVENGKGEKIVIYKYKSKKDYRKKQGHRQPFSKVEILSLDGKPSQKKETVKASQPAKKAPVKEATPAKKEAPAKEATNEVEVPNFKGMRKAEIIEFAKSNNIEINEKSTIAEITEVITKAMAK